MEVKDDPNQCGNGVMYASAGGEDDMNWSGGEREGKERRRRG